MFFKKNKKEKNQKKDLHKKEENIDFDELEKNYQNELSNIKFNKLLNPEIKKLYLATFLVMKILLLMKIMN